MDVDEGASQVGLEGALASLSLRESTRSEMSADFVLYASRAQQSQSARNVRKDISSAKLDYSKLTREQKRDLSQKEKVRLSSFRGALVALCIEKIVQVAAFDVLTCQSHWQERIKDALEEERKKISDLIAGMNPNMKV